MHKLIHGQKVSPELKQASRQFRSEMTQAEELFWSAVRNRKLNGLKFRRQQIIHGFVADFFCEELGLVVEVDGPIHDRQQDRDIARDDLFVSLGLKVLRFSNDQVLGNLDEILHMIVMNSENANKTSPPQSPSPRGRGGSFHKKCNLGVRKI